MKKLKSKSKPTKKKVTVRKTQKKKYISNVQRKSVSNIIEEDEEIAEAKIQRSIEQEDDFLDRQIDEADDEEDDEDDDGCGGEDYGTGGGF